MLKINKLLDFINKNKNWKELIKQEPYNIIVKEEGKYTLLKYNQLESDFNSTIVCDCRGIILNQDNKIVCFPFYKFFNYEEKQADKIDWNTAKVQEKIDGSLIKIWYDEFWRISTNGTINAFNAYVADECGLSYGELVEKVLPKGIYDKMNKNYTYMFELVSPESQVVVYYPETKLYHIGTRDNTTYKELDVDIGIEKPKLYNLINLDEVVEISKKMGKDEEGFVVVDSNYNRIKIKSPQYLMAKYLIGNGKMTDKRIIEIIKAGEENEILNYFPEFENKFDSINHGIIAEISKIYGSYATLFLLKDKKEYVNHIKKYCDLKDFSLLIKLYDNPNINLKLEILKMPSDKIEEMIW